MTANEPLITFSGVTKSYADGERTVRALREVSFDACRGTVTAVAGPSGSGKTTLLHLAGGVEHPDAGTVMISRTDVGELSRVEQAGFRARHVSFVFSEGNLLPFLTVAENVAIGLSLLELSAPEAYARTVASLERVGLADKAHRLPAALSSGERQRVAVARAVARGVAIVLADEPTAHLDHELAAQIIALLAQMADRDGACVLLATHDPLVAAAADSIIRLADGSRTE